MRRVEKASGFIFLVFLVALIFRLWFLFFVVPGDPADDSYHHWVIAYWTLKRGFARGRMWDLYGMEYYWGITPHLIEAILLYITRTTSLLPFRLFNVMVSSAATPFSYLLLKKYLNDDTGAICASTLVALSPLAVWETFAITEPLAIFFFLLSLYFFDRSLFLTGFFLGLAFTCRIEFWIVTPSILLYFFLHEIFKKNLDELMTSFVPLLSGCLVVALPYFYVLQAHTGIFYYPIYYNYVCSIAAAWSVPVMAPVPIRVASYIGMAASGVYVIYSIRRPRPYDSFYVPLTLYNAQIFATYGFSRALGAIFWGRFFIVGWLFLVALVSATIPQIIRKIKASLILIRIPTLSFMLLTVLLIGMLSTSGVYTNGQTAGLFAYNSQETCGFQERLAVEALKYYKGGTMIINHPTIVYYVIQHGIQPERVLSSQYAPGDTRDNLLRWLKDENVSLFIGGLNFRDAVFYNFFPEIEHGRSQPPFYLVGHAVNCPVFAVVFNSTMT